MKQKYENQSELKAKRKKVTEGKNQTIIKLDAKVSKNTEQMASVGGWSGGKGEKEINPTQQSVGFNGIFTSKGSPYKGSILADVEKSMNESSTGCKPTLKEVADHASLRLTWKRKERDEAT